MVEMAQYQTEKSDRIKLSIFRDNFFVNDTISHYLDIVGPQIYLDGTTE
jgi:hypothetical protein